MAQSPVARTRRLPTRGPNERSCDKRASRARLSDWQGTSPKDQRHPLSGREGKLSLIRQHCSDTATVGLHPARTQLLGLIDHPRTRVERD